MDNNEDNEVSNDRIPHIIERGIERRFCYMNKTCKKETEYFCRDCGDGIKRRMLCVSCFEQYHKDNLKDMHYHKKNNQPVW